MSQANPVHALDKLREQLKSRGAKTIRGLGRAFRHIDSLDGNRKVDRGEFITGLQEMGVTVTPAEADALFKLFDTDGDSTINYDEFLVGVRGALNQRRQDIVDKAFLKFDKDCSGEITAADLLGTYDCSFHPKVQSGEMTRDEVFLEFLSSFGDKNRDGRIVRSEWNDYYAAVSSSIDNDDHFIQLMKTAWKLE